jgi:hypothetical protein
MRRFVVVVGVLAALGLAGCGADDAPAGSDSPTDTGATTLATPGTAATAADGATNPSGPGCAIVNAQTVSTALGKPYVEAPTGLSDVGPNGQFSQDGYRGHVCSFDPTSGGVRDVVIMKLTNASALYDAQVQAQADGADGPGTPVAVGKRAVLFRDKLGASLVAEGTDGALLTISLTTVNDDPVEPLVTALARIALGSA